MITILPDNEYKNNILIDEKYADDVFVFTAKDNEEYLGYGAVHLEENFAEIICVKTVAGMENLEHGIFKSLLNFVERRGIYHCICALDKPQLMKRLGFESVENQWQKISKNEGYVFYLNLEGYFEKHC